MIESLYELSDDIKNHNGKIYFFKGDNLKVLNSINKIKKIESIGFNIDYTPYARKRDEEIINWCNKNKIIRILFSNLDIYRYKNIIFSILI